MVIFSDNFRPAPDKLVASLLFVFRQLEPQAVPDALKCPRCDGHGRINRRSGYNGITCPSCGGDGWARPR